MMGEHHHNRECRTEGLAGDAAGEHDGVALGCWIDCIVLIEVLAGIGVGELNGLAREEGRLRIGAKVVTSYCMWD